MGCLIRAVPVVRISTKMWWAFDPSTGNENHPSRHHFSKETHCCRGVDSTLQSQTEWFQSVERCAIILPIWSISRSHTVLIVREWSKLFGMHTLGNMTGLFWFNNTMSSHTQHSYFNTKMGIHHAEAASCIMASSCACLPLPRGWWWCQLYPKGHYNNQALSGSFGRLLRPPKTKTLPALQLIACPKR